MVGPAHPLGQPVEEFVESGHLLLGDEVEYRHALELDLGDDTEDAEADPREVEDLRFRLGREFAHRTVGAHQAQSGDGPGEPREPDPGAVRARRDRTGQGLRVDVSLILQGQADGFEQPGNVPQPSAGGKAHPLARLIDGDDSRQTVEADHDVIAGGHGGEGMSGPDDPQPVPRRRSGCDDFR